MPPDDSIDSFLIVGESEVTTGPGSGTSFASYGTKCYAFSGQQRDGFLRQ